jgi:hypothetical protein
LRGGAFNNNNRNARCANRNRNNSNNFNNNIGFRLVLSTTLRYAGNAAGQSGFAAEAYKDGWMMSWLSRFCVMGKYRNFPRPWICSRRGRLF